MPTKRSRRLRHAFDAPDLADDVVAILLNGWGAQPPSPPSPPHGFTAACLDLLDDPAALWLRHEPFLRQVALDWGWEPQWTGPDGRRRFYGEHCALGGQWFDEP